MSVAWLSRLWRKAVFRWHRAIRHAPTPTRPCYLCRRDVYGAGIRVGYKPFGDGPVVVIDGAGYVSAVVDGAYTPVVVCDACAIFADPTTIVPLNPEAP